MALLCLICETCTRLIVIDTFCIEFYPSEKRNLNARTKFHLDPEVNNENRYIKVLNVHALFKSSLKLPVDLLYLIYPDRSRDVESDGTKLFGPKVQQDSMRR